MLRGSRFIFSVIALSILATSSFLAVISISPPAPMPIHSPSTEFSAGRAMQNLEIIAHEPRPMGVNPAHANVREYLLSEIRELGLEPQVQESFGLRVIEPGFLIGGAVENILVRLPGTDPTGAILLIAHYDSAPAGPGAGDNGSGVVTLMEILRALKAGPTLRQDVIALFPDGHEPGIIGTHAFVAQHPWFDDVSFVVNMDTLRNGPPMITRTSQGNGYWIPAYADTAMRPATFSFPFDLFAGGDTDLIPFLQPGIPGVGLSGAMPGLEHHTVLDLPETVNPGTLQQAGNQLLAMVRYLGSQPTLASTVPDQTHFPVLGRLVHYPAGWAAPLAGVAGLSFLGAFYYGFRKRELTWRGLGLGFLTFLLSITICVLFVDLLWLGIQSIHPEYDYSSYRPHLSDDHLYFVAFLLIAMALTTSSIAVVRKKITALDLAAGALVIWFPLSIALVILFPATSYLLTWVLLSGSLALLLNLAVHSKRNGWILSGLGFLAHTILASFLWIPLILISFFSGPMASGFSTLSMSIGTTTLWLGSVMPILDRIGEPNRWFLPASAALAALGFLLAGHFLVGKESPPSMVNSIGYWLDAESNEAYWVAFIGGYRTDAHTSTEYRVAFPERMDERQIDLLAEPIRRPYTDLFPEVPPFSVLTSEAPLLSLEGPRMEVLADEMIESRRVVDVYFTTSMHDRLYIVLTEESPLLAITVPHNERTVLPPAGDEQWLLRFDGMPVAGIEIRFEFSMSGPIEFLLVEERTGLPSFPGLSTRPEPGTMQSPGEFLQGIPTDFTAINRNFVVQSISR